MTRVSASGHCIKNALHDNRLLLLPLVGYCWLRPSHEHNTYTVPSYQPTYLPARSQQAIHYVRIHVGYTVTLSQIGARNDNDNMANFVEIDWYETRSNHSIDCLLVVAHIAQQMAQKIVLYCRFCKNIISQNFWYLILLGTCDARILPIEGHTLDDFRMMSSKCNQVLTLYRVSLS